MPAKDKYSHNELENLLLIINSYEKDVNGFPFIKYMQENTKFNLKKLDVLYHHH